MFRVRQWLLNKRFQNRVKAVKRIDTIYLTGELDTWEEIYEAGRIMATFASDVHVVNRIELKGAKPLEMRVPKLKDKALDGKVVDVLIVGGGISGASIARELSKWNIQTLLVDKEVDFALHASSHNDGEVHVGVDLAKGSLKQKYVLKGNHMFDRITTELDVPFERVGQYACFHTGWLYPFVWIYAMKRKYVDGVRDVSLIKHDDLLKQQPTFDPSIRFAMYNHSAGIVSPWELTYAYAENAAKNGVDISLNTVVEGMEVEDENIVRVYTNRGTVYPRIVINAAGVFADDIAKMAKDQFYSIHPRRGTDAIQDLKSNKLIHTVASNISVGHKKKSKHSKGGGLMRTIHGNVLAGPDAVECREKEDFATYPESIKRIYEKQKKTIPDTKQSDIIAYFTGIRAATYEEDFIIEWGRRCHNLYHVAGIQSPGLTSAPAIAIDVAQEIASFLQADRNENFDPIRRGIVHVSELSDEARQQLIAANPDYGKIICRCEQVSKGEIIDALNRPYCPQTIDAVKKRVRPGTGRCQGGFCMPLVAGIIAEKNGIKMEDVMKSSDKSYVLIGSHKGEQS